MKFKIRTSFILVLVYFDNAITFKNENKYTGKYLE